MQSDAAQLIELVAGRDEGGYVELRWAPKGQPMRREFYACNERRLETATTEALRFAGYKADVFVGAAPRLSPLHGGKSNIAHAWCLWADCDSPESVERLAGFDPQPTLAIASGSPGRLHAWWSLDRAVPARHVERANKRLAHHLGADPKCADVARILRLPGTLNHKHDPPAPVAVVSSTDGHLSLSFTANLPDPSDAPAQAAQAPRVPAADTLLGISAVEYVPKLTGRQVNGRGYVQCPFHSGGNERTPSLKVYPDPSKGWRCFGCDRGGSVFDFGGLLWNLNTRGAGFVALRERLEKELL